MAPVNCATPATLVPGSSARTAAAGIIAAVWDTSMENSFANYVDNFLLTSDVSLA